MTGSEAKQSPHVGPRTRSIALESKSQYSSAQWQELSEDDQNEAISKVSHEQDLRQVNTIFYELLKQNPNTIGHGAALPNHAASNQSNAIVDAGIVSSVVLSSKQKIWRMNFLFETYGHDPRRNQNISGSTRYLAGGTKC
jgi:hypothetical protein